MKKQFVAAVAVLTLGASMAFAGPNHEGHGGRGRQHGMFGQKMAEKLNLSDAQKQQIRDIKKSFREENKAFFTASRENFKAFREAKKAGDTAKADSLKPTLDAQRAQMKQLREQEQQRVLSVLTAEQRTQLEQLKAERAAKRQNRQ
jgi:protein CpxP